MDTVIKVLAGALIAVVLGLTLRQQGKDMALLLSTAVCCMVLAVGILYLKPVIEFARQLSSAAGTDPEILEILLKSVGIGLLSEIAGLICTDAGNAAMAKTIQILSAAVILWLAIPLMKGLLELVGQLMGEV